MFREWDETKAPDNFLLKYPLHDSFHQYMITLNDLYRSYRAFTALDYDPDGFEWLAMNDQGHDVFAIRRNVRRAAGSGGAAGGRQPGKREERQAAAKEACEEFREADLTAVFNFSARERRLTMQSGKTESWELILHTDWEKWSGSRREEPERLDLEAGEAFTLTLAPFSGALYRIV